MIMSREELLNYIDDCKRGITLPDLEPIELRSRTGGYLYEVDIFLPSIKELGYMLIYNVRKHSFVFYKEVE